MNKSVEQLTKEWIAHREGIDPQTIEHVVIESLGIHEGSPDLDDDDFSTFAGLEMFSAEITFTDGRHESRPLYDINPVNEILDYQGWKCLD